jgi:hypothetical protein
MFFFNFTLKDNCFDNHFVTIFAVFSKNFNCQCIVIDIRKRNTSGAFPNIGSRKSNVCKVTVPFSASF